MNKHSLKDWATAVRPWSFPASAMPVIVTAAYIFWKTGVHESLNFGDPVWLLGLWALINIIIFHAAGNTWSDYFDFKKNVDTAETSGAKTLTEGMFTPGEIKKLSVSLLVIALAGGLGLLLMTGLPLLWIGLGGLACTVLYPFMKYNALGDAVIIAAYAVLPTLGTAYVITGQIIPEVLWIAVPVGLITDAILHSNNTRDIYTDRNARINTLAMSMGVKAAKFLYYLEVLIPFLWIAGCVVCGILPVWNLTVIPALFLAIANVITMSKAREDDMSAISSIDEMTAKLQLLFSLLFSISFVLAYYF